MDSAAFEAVTLRIEEDAVVSAILRHLLTEINFVQLVVAIVVLPLVYYRDCNDVHREYSRMFRDLAKENDPSIDIKGLRRLMRATALFSLEWWYIVALAVFLISVFTWSEALALSTRLTVPTDLQTAKALSTSAGLSFSISMIYYFKVQKQRAFQLMTAYGKRRLREIVRDRTGDGLPKKES